MVKPHEDRQAKKRYEKDKAAAKVTQSNINAMAVVMLERREGRDYLWWLLSIAGVNQSAMTGNALTTAFNCGKQDLGNQILAHVLEISPNGYMTMLKEHNDAARTNRDDSDGEAGTGDDDGASDDDGDEI